MKTLQDWKGEYPAKTKDQGKTLELARLQEDNADLASFSA
jgi:hypothetical protein